MTVIICVIRSVTTIQLSGCAIILLIISDFFGYIIELQFQVLALLRIHCSLYIPYPR